MLAQETQKEVPGYVAVPCLAVNVEGHLGTPILLPEELILTELYGQPGDFLCMRVEGPSMSPALEEGDRVLIDRRRAPEPEPGLFAIDEGSGLEVRWVGSMGDRGNVSRYRVWTEDGRCTYYTSDAGRIQIFGRVVWAGRLL